MNRVYVPDIECDSCVKLITKKLSKNNVKNFEVKEDSVIINDNINPKTVVNMINEMGYRASTEPFERKTFKERVRHFKENRHLYKVEMQGINHAISVTIALFGLTALIYFFLFRDIEGFLGSYGWWIFYLIISIVSIGIATWHYTAYKAKITCMTGMMIGMTFGMQTGMMIGAVIGATNGFFWGAMVGMILGTTIGVITGKCCGVMGVMEGAMAGLMGGTMGPMITVMMFSDHVLWFMPFYMIINVGIIIGLSYMLYEEVVEGKKVTVNPMDGVTLISISIIVTALLVALMVYGPTSALISFY
ncbi:MAG: heavy metal-associated domain-containing protein [archaeon]